MKNEVIELVLTEAQIDETPPTDNSRGNLRLSPGLPGVVIGVVTELNGSGEPIVEFCENNSVHLMVARSTVALTQTEIGREAVLTFERGDPSKPIILGLLHGPTATRSDREIRGDDEKLVLTAKNE